MKLAILFAISLAAPALAFDQTHAAFDTLLKANVKGGMVDYKALKSQAAPLKDYLDELAKVPEPEFKTWPRHNQIAFLANLYNASTLKLIIDHYPVKSIKDIGSVFKGPWKQPSVQLWGKTITLDDLEHTIIRPTYSEPRLHFALVCAAKGCPPLRAEAYVGERLEDQLNDQGKTFLAQKKMNNVDAVKKQLHLSPIFDWYGKDFTEKSGFVDKFILPFLSEADQKAVSVGGFAVDYTAYDWTLNEQK